MWTFSGSASSLRFRAARAIQDSETLFVFSDGHGIATFTQWFDDLDDLRKLDWDMIHARLWKDTVDDMDRQRRKQAEFLAHRFVPWKLVEEIAVLNRAMKANVEGILAGYPEDLHRVVRVRREWYY